MSEAAAQLQVGNDPAAVNIVTPLINQTRLCESLCVSVNVPAD